MQTSIMLIMQKEKKKIVVLPSSGISEYLGRLVGIFFPKSSFFKHQKYKYKIWVHFYLFSEKRWKNTQSDKNLVHSRP